MKHLREIIRLFFQHNELLCWTCALVLLYFLNTTHSASTLCPFTWLGFANCPGCGIGHAIHEALHLDFSRSFAYHPMGIPAVIIIFMRIKILLYPILTKSNETKSH